MKLYHKSFSDSPTEKYVCPRCKTGALVVEKDSFTFVEPFHSKQEHTDDSWDPYWIEFRFAFKSRCDRATCGEVSHCSGVGGVDQRYDYEGVPEYFNYFKICSFIPAPLLVAVPEKTPPEVMKLISRSFALYWTDTSAAANALRASLESLLDEMKIPRTQTSAKGGDHRLNLHQRMELWSKQEAENAELCQVLKEVGNLGSHGEIVGDKDYIGVLNIYSHVLFQLFDNNAMKMKELAASIIASIKNSKAAQYDL